MDQLEDQQYNLHVLNLLRAMSSTQDSKKARQELRQQIEIINDHRFLPAVLEIGMALSAQPGATVDPEIFAMVMMPEARKVLLGAELSQIGRGGACTVLMASDDQETFTSDVDHLCMLLDDAFFDQFAAMIAVARRRGLSEFADDAESRARAATTWLTLSRLNELEREISQGRSTRAGIELIIEAAQTMPGWFTRGIDEIMGEDAESPEPLQTTLPGALQRARQAILAGQRRQQIVQLLEAKEFLQLWIAHVQMRPSEPFEDRLEMYGEREKQRLIRVASQTSAQFAALMKLALAGDEAEAWRVASEEPALFTDEAESQSRRFASDAAAQHQFTLAQGMQRASERLQSWRSELATPELNAVSRIAARVRAKEITLDDALGLLNGPDAVHGLDTPHFAVVDDQIVKLYRTGNLYEAEILAILNRAAVYRIATPKMCVYANISLAQIQNERGAGREAITLLQEAEKLAQSIDDRELLAHVSGVLGLAYQGLDEYPHAIESFNRALDIAQVAHMEQLQVAMLGNLAGVHLLMGLLQQSLDYSEQALQLAQASGDPYQIAQGLGTRATVLHQASRLDEAIDKYQEALQLVVTFKDLQSEIRLRSHLGQAFAEVGKSELAIQELEKAFKLAQGTGNLPLEASILSGLGGVYYTRGDLRCALEHFKKSLEIEERLGLREKMAATLTNLAQLHLRLHQFDHAKSALDRALVLGREIRNLHAEMYAQLGLGHYFIERSAWQESAAAYGEAQRLAHELDNPRLELMALGNLGRIEELQDHLIEAVGVQNQVLERARKLGFRIVEAEALISLGAVQAKIGDNERARETLIEAIRATRELNLVYGRYYGHYNLGLLYDSAFDDLPRALEQYQQAVAILEQERQALGEIEEFEQRYFEDKSEVYLRAAEVFFRMNQPLDALQMLEQGRTRLLVRRLSRRDSLPPDVPEELRARYSRTVEAVQFLRTIVHGEVGWGMKIRQDLRRSAAELRGMPIDEQQEQEGYRKALAEAEIELTQIVETIRAYAPNFGGLRVELPRLDFAKIAQDPATAVMALFVGHSISRAVVLHPSGVRIVNLPDLTRDDVQHLLWGLPEPLSAWHRQAQEQFPGERTPDQAFDISMFMHYTILRAMIEETDSFEIGWAWASNTLIEEKERADRRARNLRDPKLHAIMEAIERDHEPTVFDIDDNKRLAMWKRIFIYTSNELKSRLWKLLLPVLRDCQVVRTVIIPDASLHSLPLAVGVGDEEGTPNVMLAPSLTLYTKCLQWLYEREPRENTLMLIANPTQDLSAADLEAILLRDLFSAHHEVTFQLTGEQATQQNVLRTSRVGNYWHFAGHARYDGWNPSLSALSLANGENFPLFWIPMWMDFQATRLATLGGCETGMTPARDPLQEYAGLFTAFLAAGAPTVLASLFPVENVSTALLMYRFYQNHLGDPREGIACRPPAEALRDAQKWLREVTCEELAHHTFRQLLAKASPLTGDPIWPQVLHIERHERPFENPYYWAGFVVAGA